MGVHAVVLAAGYATRLYPLTQDRPKALLPLGEGTVLDWLFGRLVQWPLADVTVVSNHRFYAQFAAWQRGRKAAVPVRVLDDGTTSDQDKLGAIRDLALAMDRQGARGDLVVAAGDNVFTWEMPALWAAVQRHPASASVVVTDVADRQLARQYGIVTCAPDGRITSFVEKPSDPPSTLAATGLYYLPARPASRVAEYLQSGAPGDQLGHWVRWLSEREPVYGIRGEGVWYDIGDVQTYERVKQSLQRRTTVG